MLKGDERRRATLDYRRACDERLSLTLERNALAKRIRALGPARTTDRRASIGILAERLAHVSNDLATASARARRLAGELGLPE
jgi:hypothetical protein